MCWSKVASETNGIVFERHKVFLWGDMSRQDRDGELVLELRVRQVGWAQSSRDRIVQWIKALEARRI